MATQELPATHPRVVQALMVTYFAVDLDPIGNLVTVVRTANRGEEINLTEREEQRLDQYDLLAEPGKTAKQTDEDAKARLDSYRAMRGDQTAVERAVKRAVAPSVQATGAPEPPESVSPPGQGAAPRGTYTQGDRGAPDIQPRGAAASGRHRAGGRPGRRRGVPGRARGVDPGGEAERRRHRRPGGGRPGPGREGAGGGASRDRWRSACERGEATDGDHGGPGRHGSRGPAGGLS